MTLLRQENIDISIFIFDQLLSLMSRSEGFRDTIVLSIKNECLHSFCPDSIIKLEFQKLSRLNQIIALTKSVKELLDQSFENRLEDWLSQILESDFSLNIELKDYLILSDFFCLNLCLKVPSAKFVSLMRETFIKLLSKLKQSEESDQEITSVFIFFVKITKIWMKIECIRTLDAYEEFPDPNKKIKSDNTSTSKIGNLNQINMQMDTSYTSENNMFLTKKQTRYGFHKKFFLLEDRLFYGFIKQIWWFYKQIKDSETKFYDNLQQRSYLEILNSMFSLSLIHI